MSLTPAMKQMLQGMTPAQIETMIQTAKQPRLTVELPVNLSRGKGKKKLGRAAPAAKVTRPLNSWIAFRSYYAAAFPKYQQKEISGFLRNIWKSDPFKAKWSILAKSYSVIRDHQGKEITPLDHFLAITGPLIGIIKPEHYLQIMGWEIAMKPDGQTVMNHYDLHLEKSLFATNLSVNDIIRHCHRQGFFVGILTEVLSSENEVVMTMATSFQRTPTTPVPVLGHTQAANAQLMGDMSAGSAGEEMCGPDVQGITAESPTDPSPANKGQNAVEETTDLGGDAHNASAAQHIVVEDDATAIPDPANMASNTTLETTSGTNDIQPEVDFDESEEVVQQPQINYAALNPAAGLSAANFPLASEYPHNEEFDPNSTSFIFDPFQGYQFDAFDMSNPAWADIIDFNACS